MFKSTSTLNAFRIAIIIFAVLILGSGVRLAVINRNPGNQIPIRTTVNPQITLPQPNLQTSAQVIYASPKQNSTPLLIVDNQANPGILLELPVNIKHVNYLANINKFLYISEVGTGDYGKKIAIHDIDTNNIQILATATDTFGIDDVVVSPDNTMIAWWEVKRSPNNVLLDGQSKVYIKNIALDSAPVAIADETATATVPIHYPLFFDAQNILYLDSFIPNGGGFYLGLYSINAVNLPNPIALTHINEMADGNYLSDPLMSPDGQKLLFTAYDNTIPAGMRFNTLGTLSVNRANNMNPNQIVVMDIATKQKTVARGSTGGAQYANPRWGSNSTSISYEGYTVTSPQLSTFDGVFQYNLGEAEAKKVNIANLFALNLIDYSGDYVVWGRMTNNVGNLSPKYSSILSELNMTNINTGETISLIAAPNIQHIATVNNSLLAAVPLNKTGLELSSFTVNAVLTQRQIQQNDPIITPGNYDGEEGERCRDVCGLPGFGAHQPGLADPSGHTPSLGEWAACKNATKCYDSPLYLYPIKTIPITVNIPGAYIFSPKPPLVNNSFWHFVAQPNGILTTNNKKYSKVEYSYLSPYEANAPKEGVVCSKADLHQTLRFFADNFNLNKLETADYINFWESYLPDSSYYQVGYYDQETTAKILPLKISPTPDTLIRIIMYFKPLSQPIDIKAPQFNKQERVGFVAVDWSGKIDY